MMKSTNFRKRLITQFALYCILLPSLSGCNFASSSRTHDSIQRASYHTIAFTKASPSPELIEAEYRPNEAGEIPILEYHDIVNSLHATGYQYRSSQFRSDVQWLYAHGYRPVNLSDYVDGKIDIPAGLTPVIFTFDDGLRGQYNILPDGKVDPNCAVGILEAFHQQHNDWALKGTFFVLTNYDPHLPPPFYQPQFAEEKLQHLVRDGFEIGNHTVHHWMGMNRFPNTKVESEFAGGAAGINHYLPQYKVDELALPYGVYPHDIKLVESGDSNGLHYSNICAMLAGANPALSPMNTRFNPYLIPRIIPGEEPFAMQFWLNYLQEHPKDRFISDGNPLTYTVPSQDKRMLDKARIKNDGYSLVVYNSDKVRSIAKFHLAHNKRLI